MSWNLVSSNCDDETITNVFHKNHHFKLTPEEPVTRKQKNSLFTLLTPEMFSFSFFLSFLL